jgi:hypothetical protein
VSENYPQLPSNSNLILACHITGVYDVNRSTTLQDDNFELVRAWAESVAAAKVNGVLFHNGFSEETCQTYENEYLTFVKITCNPQFNPNVYRYLVYLDFLEKQANFPANIFVTDVSDVTLVNDPFTDPLFIASTNTLFCGDEPTVLENEWMLAHASSLRSQIDDYADYEARFAGDTLLNCGIIGGAYPLFLAFLQELCAIHRRYNSENKTAYTGDMGAFNFLARTKFNELLHHGFPVNTVFKGYEESRNDCWFRHK